MEAEQVPWVDVRVDLDARIHYSIQQNDVPVVKQVQIENRSGRALRDLELRIATEPEFAGAWAARIASIDSGAVYNLSAVDLDLSPTFLGELTERVRGRLLVRLREGSALIFEQTLPVELLALDEWAGLASLPEILAAFVLPNHPAVAQLLRTASDLLLSWGEDGALSGYQSQNRRHVYAMVAAVYGALQKLELGYVNPPASFEAEGQRVRLPDRIVESRMATCLDVTLLAAACLEQIGLHPLLILVQGHAFAGVWLEDECFPEPSSEDPLRVRKRVDLDEIAVFEPTGVTARPALDFERSVVEAKRRLANESAFVCAIDVRRARKGRIRPLPLRVASGDTTTGPESHATAALEPSAPDVSSIVLPERESPAASTETPATRLDRWCRKLLDLSLRNRLLNFRDSKKSLPLLCPDLARVEDMLAAGKSVRVLPKPSDLSEADPRDAAAHERRTGEDALRALLLEELASHRLRADATPEELERRMTEIYRAARLGIEEGGASTLYLALGFLAWYESPKSDRRHIAPILLLPLELHRKSVREGFTLRLADDDARINVTLLELLKQDFGVEIGGLDPLPEDESGLDVSGILRTVRRAIRDIDRWDVLDEARIGLFSFTKFLMWRDLNERSADLMKNAIVEHLVLRPKEPFDPHGSFPRIETLDRDRAPTQTFCPMPADSSQLAAVIAAAEGRSFVLEGPPGTGKSQTITNLIAQCLAEGKTVLFVSEKMAALNVVQRRLHGVGLGRFCLELHSNKAQRREIMAQIQEALERLESRTAEEWEREALRVAELRSELNAYVDALHRRRSTGETFFEATSRLIGLRDAPKVALRWPDPEALDGPALRALRDLVDRWATAGGECGAVLGHAWEGVGHADWTPGWQDEAQRHIESLRAAVERVREAASACAARLGFAHTDWSTIDLERMRDVGRCMMRMPTPPIELMLRPDWEELQASIDAWIHRGRERDDLRREIHAHFRNDLLALDLEALRSRLRRADAAWWPASWWKRRTVHAALRAVTHDANALPKERLPALLERAARLRDVERELAGSSEAAQTLLGRYWQGGEASWDAVGELRDGVRDLRELATRAAGGDLERAAELRRTWAQLCIEGRELLRGDATIGREMIAHADALDALESARRAVSEALAVDPERVWGSAESPAALEQMSARATRWLVSMSQLRAWCAWRRVRTEAVQRQLAPLVDAYEDGTVDSEQLRACFERSYTEWWHDAIMDREPVLSRFLSPEHERKIDAFRSTDERYMQLTRQVIEARLAQGLPSQNGAGAALPNSELGILKRELDKKRRHMPVRQLLQKTTSVLPRLKPCVLMSPMSVAQYLDASYPPFDIVVFDEASQIPVWDAVGAIARGRQAIIVGDPKQLPPTSFFQRAEEEEDGDDDVVEDLESILDDCRAAQIPQLGLDWHYRSRHESLITFSNYHYYGNRLLTFPSAAIDGLGVSWRPVAHGVYDRGKTRTNRAEADALVQEIRRRLRDPELSEYSIGVVTFSQAQQSLIEDLLDAARVEDPSLDPFFAEEREEPLFVKNLENVQGDERDVILFSICYGPDMAGKVHMEFGPLNRDGGERRLNVAITRARREVLVFSTLRADQIDLARTKARGVQHLKGFLEYAQRGASALAEATQLETAADFESPFEEDVARALIERGWELHRQVGCARYRIDLAVLDPDAPGRYLLGIECDGANYHRAKTARDRDKLREGILRGLGWTLHRIWSTDWWIDPQRELTKIEQALERARTRSPSKLAVAPDTRAVAREPSSAPLFASAPLSSPDRSEPPRTTSAPASAAVSAPVSTQDRSAIAGPGFDMYRPAQLESTGRAQSDFYEPASSREISRRIAEVVRREGPISLALAARRVAEAWGFERVRARALEHIRERIPSTEVHAQQTNAGIFLWPAALSPDDYASFRVPGADGTGTRAAEDLPVEEVANVFLHLLRTHGSAPEAELTREAARLLGFQRTGRVVHERMKLGLELLKSRGRVIEDRGIVSTAR